MKLGFQLRVWQTVCMTRAWQGQVGEAGARGQQGQIMEDLAAEGIWALLQRQLED